MRREAELSEKEAARRVEERFMADQRRRDAADAGTQTDQETSGFPAKQFELEDPSKQIARELSWQMSEAATAAILEYASKHAAAKQGTDSGMLLYGARALNCYLAHAGLQIQTRDFDFKVIARNVGDFIHQCELCILALPVPMQPACILQPGPSSNFMHLVVYSNRVADFTWLPVPEFVTACAAYGAPLRVGSVGAESQIPELVGCAVMHPSQLVALLQDDPGLPGWRRRKNRAQLDTVELAQEIGLWYQGHQPVSYTHLTLPTKRIV
eukprot:TRINITY_DN9176_c0_g2_i5.p1 TRINITY_DN9176_c0_g2~~TRINITY_DN9176_c0_g2_i5.p1  ORF type:complete len:268 (-),score=69.10 TRINITY_DN9176_c0_g2_i5:145-948(-)